jgi:hypothetical protein
MSNSECDLRYVSSRSIEEVSPTMRGPKEPVGCAGAELQHLEEVSPTMRGSKGRGGDRGTCFPLLRRYPRWRGDRRLYPSGTSYPSSTVR